MIALFLNGRKPFLEFKCNLEIVMWTLVIEPVINPYEPAPDLDMYTLVYDGVSTTYTTTDYNDAVTVQNECNKLDTVPMELYRLVTGLGIGF